MPKVTSSTSCATRASNGILQVSWLPALQNLKGDHFPTRPDERCQQHLALAEYAPMITGSPGALYKPAVYMQVADVSTFKNEAAQALVSLPYLFCCAHS